MNLVLFMNYKSLYRSFGVVAFLVATVVYLMTVQPTVPFWDCGEFSAAAIWQQVPHPPGAPLFLMIGKMFDLLIPFGDPGWKINLVAVFSASFTIWLMYLISVKVIINLRKEDFKTLGDEIAVYGSALVGALALTFSDTFWFNSVESEVYATSSLFVAIVIYLMMRWNEESENPGHERYLLLIAYLIGLSTGVHLLAVLTIFSIVTLVYFKKYKVTPTSFIIMGAVAVAIFFIVYPGIVKWVPAMLNGNLPFKNGCGEYIVADSTGVFLFTIAGILAVIGAFVYGYIKKMPMLKLISSAFIFVLMGYTTYTQILLRSNANPPMNENTPKDLSSLTSYLGREQYGDAPSWPRRYQRDSYYTRHYHEHGKWFPPSTKPVECKDGSRIGKTDFKKINFSGEINFLMSYQINHMYWRYFFWNFVGRTSDIQDAGWTFADTKEAELLNHESGYADLFPIRFFALPLLFGLLGLFFQFWHDPKMAVVYLFMFLLMGILATIQQNQQAPQPRERDYFYAGSFMIWAMWIGMGAYAIIKSLAKGKVSVGIAAGVVLISMILVPGIMAKEGWKLHSRAGNYLPFDYSYNILQSCDENAILFTNGDNDTFPVWWLQDVMGIRRDVRIVNLSLGNTLWYVDQLKNREPWGAAKIPLSFPDKSLRSAETDPESLSYFTGPEMNFSVPVRREIMAKFTDDPEKLANPKFNFTLTGKPLGERDGKMNYVFRVQDQVVLNIIQMIKFERPVYFSSTVGGDAFAGLKKFFRNEGMAMRVCPVVQQKDQTESIDIEVMDKCLLNIDNSTNFETGPSYGFKLRNLSNQDVYYDEVHRRLMHNYRSLYTGYALYSHRYLKDSKRTAAILDTMNKYISPKQFPMSFDLLFRITRIYEETGAVSQTKEWAQLTVDACQKVIDTDGLNENHKVAEILGKSWGPYRVAATAYEMAGDFQSAKNTLGDLITASEKVLANPATSSDDIQGIQYSIYNLKVEIDEYDITALEVAGKKTEALAKAKALYKSYIESADKNIQYLSQFIKKRILALEAELQIADGSVEN